MRRLILFLSMLCVVVGLNSVHRVYAQTAEVQHVLYDSVDGNIHELFAGDTWSHNNLTQAAQVPIGAAPHGYVTGGNTQHVVFCTLGQPQNALQVFELFAGDTWKYNNLTALTSAPLCSTGPRAYVTGSTQHVVYGSEDGHIHELFTGDTWSHNDLITATQAPLGDTATLNNSPYGYVTNGVQHVVYIGRDAHVHELFAGDTWSHNDLTAITQAPNAISAPTAYLTNGRLVQHVVYVGSDKHIHELFSGDTWSHNDLTAAAQAPNALGIKPVGCITRAGQSEVQHVVFLGEDGHIHELFAGDTWSHNDLTAIAQAPTSSAGLDAYTTSGGRVQHVVYCGEDGHVHELFSGDTWAHNDLTTATRAPETCSLVSAYVTGSPVVIRIPRR